MLRRVAAASSTPTTAPALPGERFLPRGGRALVVRLSALGDVLFALETVAALKHERPDVHVDFLAAFYAGPFAFVGSSPTTRVHLASFGGWELLSFAFEVPFGVDRCYVSITATCVVGLNVDLYLDDLSLERVD